MKLSSLKPGVPRWVLLLLSGAMWLGVGAMLTYRAAAWLGRVGGASSLVLTSAGLVGGAFFHRVSFSRIVRKNLARIESLGERTCLFAFQSARSWGIVAFMVGLGLALRSSALPREYLAVPYLAVGSALAVASSAYWRELVLRFPWG